MKRKKIISVILISILMITNITGCKTLNNSNNVETQNFSLNIDGEKIYIAEDDQEIRNIHDFVAQYLPLSIGIDYTSEGYLDNLLLFTDETIISDEETGFRDYVKELNIERQLIRTLHEHTITEVELYNIAGEPYATVTLNYIASVSSAVDEYLEANGIELNSKFQVTTSLKLKRQDNGWRMVEILAISDPTTV